MKLSAIIGIIFCILPSVNAAEIKYPAASIPEVLKKDAVAVVRLDERVMEKSGDYGAILKINYAITILNENGKEAGYFHIPYNKFVKVRNIFGTIYDENGKRDRKIKSDEIVDVSSIGSFSLYDDQRVKLIYPECQSYPYTVEYLYEIEMKEVLSYPAWDMLPDYNISLEKGSYIVSVPDGETLRYKGINFDQKPEIQKDGSSDTYKWVVSNIPIMKFEPSSRSSLDIFPMLYLSPEEFSYGGVKGNLGSWKEFGDWVQHLVDGKDIFTEETEAEIRKLVEPASGSVVLNPLRPNAYTRWVMAIARHLAIT